MISRSCDVAVVGGGPSGLHAAKRLAGEGFEVAVFEKKAAVGDDVVCTGIVGSGLFAEFDLAGAPVLRDLSALTAVSPSGAKLEYRHPRPFARVVDRGGFDRALAAEATGAGAAVYPGVSIADIQIGADKAVLRARREGRPAEKWSARYVILATGIDLSLSRRLGLGVPAEFLAGAQAEIEAANGSGATIFVGPSFAPGGFAWAVPSVEGRLMVGVVSNRRPAQHLAALLESRFGLPGGAAGPRIRVKPIAQGLLKGTSGHRVLALGEAAGQVKTTTGGGIYYGLVCARIAAETVAEALRGGAPLGGYERRWKDALRREIVIGYRARKLFARLSDGQVERLFEIAASDGILPLVRERGDFDWQSGIILDLVRKAPVWDLLRGLPGLLPFRKAS